MSEPAEVAGLPESAARVDTSLPEPPKDAAPQAESKPPETSNGHIPMPTKAPPPKPASPTKKPPSLSSSTPSPASATSSSDSAPASASAKPTSSASSVATKTAATPAKPTTTAITTTATTPITKPTTATNGTPKPASTLTKTTTTTTPTTKPAMPTKPVPAKPTGTPTAKPTTTTTSTTTTPKVATTTPKTTTTTTGAKPATTTSTAPKTTTTAVTVKKEGAATTVKKEGEANGMVKKEGGTEKKVESKTPVTVKKEGGASTVKKEAPKRKKNDESEDDSSSDDSDSDEGDSSDSESDTPLEDKVVPTKKASVSKTPSSNANNKSTQPPAKRQATATNTTNTPQSKPVTKKVTPAAKAPPKKKAKAESDDSDSSSTDSSSDSSDSDSSDSSDSDDSESKKPNARKQVKREKKNAVTSDTKVNSVSHYEVRAENVALKAEHGANKWWNRLQKKHVKWNTLLHNGPRFPPPYVPHKVPLLYDGHKIELSPNTEEVATFYASMLETDFMNKPVFKKNFFHDWRSVMTSEEKSKITSLDKCNFKPIHAYLMADREKKKEEKKLPANKAKTKEEQAELNEIYGFARVDGYLEKVGNYRVEPPSLFRGRGEHPKTGMLKKRIRPEDVVINIGKGVQIPRPPEGHTWKGVVHNNKVTWLAFWQDNINKDFKYVYLSATSRFKGESDIAKYAKAQTLIKHIGTIRKKYNSEMTHKDRFHQQLAVALYALDVLALRVGNEKDTDNRADTVGLCSLRVEHITFPCPEEHKVRLNFLGKDSMVYDNTVSVPPAVYDNLVKFTVGKGPKADLFEKLDPGILNDHLKEIMPGLSAKVFRTYNASVTLEQELEKGEEIDVNSSESEKIHFYNKANTTVAILCNHQRSVPKAHAGQMEKIEESLAALQKELKDLKKNKKDNQSKIAKCEEKIEKKELQKTLKSTTATVALGTSKINYMDPRVTVAWCKKVDLPIEKVFNASLIMKFPWAMEVPSSWKFDPALNPKSKLKEED